MAEGNGKAGTGLKMTGIHVHWPIRFERNMVKGYIWGLMGG